MEGTPEKSSPMRHARFAIAEDNDNSNGNNATASRPKKPPPITPRRFTKFFTPRPRNAVQAVRTSRKALRKITGPALNSRSQKRHHYADEAEIVSMPTIDENQSTQPTRKRKYSAYSATPSIASSPIKAGGFLSSSQENGPRLGDRSRASWQKDIEEDEEAETEREDTIDDETSDEEDDRVLTPPRIPYRSISTSASLLSTRLTGRRVRKEAPDSYAWQDQISNFVSSPEDVYECNTTGGHAILPFCVASCNTNSLVAIGEEEGGIRLIESAAGDKKGFSRAYLKMKPHDNAIMDLEFSDDDRLLATASGDQTSHVIDMSTQTSVFCLAEHHSSIKRVQFQPGSGNNVLATCSRDGSVNIWDLRSPPVLRPSFRLRSAGRADELPERHPNVRHIPTLSTIRDAHGTHVSKWNPPGPRFQVNPVSGRNDFSVTAISFIGASRQHMLVTASEANAVIKLWDIRATHNNSRRHRATPVSSTAPPVSDCHNRSYGITSLALGGDGARLYAMCRDNTLYAYSTSHLVVGDMSLNPSTPSKHNHPAESPGLGPLYGFIHPRLRVATFYPKLAVRKAGDGTTELLAAGSSDDCAVLFPTDERYLTKSTQVKRDVVAAATEIDPSPTKLYHHGTPLTRAHGKEVTAVAWTSEGSLVTVSDDFSSRCWRENANKARDLRLKGEAGGRRWMMGWAEVSRPDYDDE